MVQCHGTELSILVLLASYASSFQSQAAQNHEENDVIGGNSTVVLNACSQQPEIPQVSEEFCGFDVQPIKPSIRVLSLFDGKCDWLAECLLHGVTLVTRVKFEIHLQALLCQFPGFKCSCYFSIAASVSCKNFSCHIPSFDSHLLYLLATFYTSFSQILMCSRFSKINILNWLEAFLKSNPSIGNFTFNCGSR